MLNDQSAVELHEKQARKRRRTKPGDDQLKKYKQASKKLATIYKPKTMPQNQFWKDLLDDCLLDLHDMHHSYCLELPEVQRISKYKEWLTETTIRIPEEAVMQHCELIWSVLQDKYIVRACDKECMKRNAIIRLYPMCQKDYIFTDSDKKYLNSLKLDVYFDQHIVGALGTVCYPEFTTSRTWTNPSRPADFIALLKKLSESDFPVTHRLLQEKQKKYYEEQLPLFQAIDAERQRVCQTLGFFVIHNNGKIPWFSSNLRIVQLHTTTIIFQDDDGTHKYIWSSIHKGFLKKFLALTIEPSLLTILQLLTTRVPWMIATYLLSFLPNTFIDLDDD